ncbi:MAG TPA: hypothetical protein VFL98_02150 [Candidatus Paceibacterota bacterium]|nr:hypothetical protein [Candidatus Paceibacterota bacterium]
MRPFITYVSMILVGYYMVRLGQWDTHDPQHILPVAALGGWVVTYAIVLGRTINSELSRTALLTRVLWIAMVSGATFGAVLFGCLIPEKGSNPFSWISSDPVMLIALAAFSPLFWSIIASLGEWIDGLTSLAHAKRPARSASVTNMSDYRGKN